jgi:Na+/proline symporter
LNAVLLSIIAYIAVQLMIGFWVSRRLRNETDYLLAGRRLGPWLATFTVFATWFGAETCIGSAGQAYSGGLAATQADPFGYAAGILAFGLFIAVPLWKLGIVTLADLYRSRFGPGIERLTAIIMIPTSLLWAAAQIRAFGQVLAAAGQIEVAFAITLAAAVVVAYTTAGGMLADAYTDLVQGLVLIAGILIIAAAAVQQDGIALLAQQPAARLSLMGGERSWLAIAEALAVPILGSLVAQELASRVLAMRSSKLARAATISASFMYLAIGLIPVALGLVAAGLIDRITEPEQVLMVYAQHTLPAVLYIVFIGALISAILSTVDSALLVAGSLTAHNIVLRIWPGFSGADKLRINRIAVFAFGLAAYGLALGSDSVYGLVVEASSLGTSGLVVVLVFALWGKRIGHAPSAYAALIVGTSGYLLGAHALSWDYPFITSLMAAFLAYLALVFVRPSQPAAARSITDLSRSPSMGN